MDVKPGYKRTEVGVIPEEWRLTSVKELTSEAIRNGYSPVCPDVETGLWTLSLSAVTHYGYFPGGSKPAPKDDPRVLETTLSIGDLLISRSNTPERVGLAGIYNGVPAPCSYPDLMMRVRLTKKVIPEYLLLHFLSGPGRTYFTSRARGSSGSMVKIDRELLEAYLLPLPPIPEQHAIATALSDVDALIARLDRLVAKKRDLKQAAMQQLLTGKTRLPGFSGVWEGLSIVELCENIIDFRGRTPKKLGMDWGGGEIPALSANNVKMGYIDFSTECHLGSEELYDRWMTQGHAKKGDLVVTLEAPLGNIAAIPDDQKYILSQRTVLLQIDRSRYSSNYLLQVLSSSHFQGVLANNSTGSTAQGIKRRSFELLEVQVPSLPEQSAIAQVLFDMDAEISSLEARRDKTKALKQAMMQELLTGRIRLV